MKKNMYSLILSENVIAAVDALAVRKGTSRSAMVNAILAEYVSYTTPEMRMREIIGRMECLLGQELAVVPNRSESQISLRSAIEYKYNPAVNYCVRLFAQGDIAGEIRVALRTRNETLIEALNRFFLLWTALEGPDGGCSVENGRFTKLIRPERPVREDVLSDAIAEYIRAFDHAMKAFFEGNPAYIGTIYATYRRSVPINV